MTKHQLAVIGAGSWGTALAIAASRNQVDTVLWGPDVFQLNAMARNRCNQAFLADVPFPPLLQTDSDLSSVVAQSELILIAVPSHAFKTVLVQLKPLLQQQAICWATKGLDPKSTQFPSEIVAEVLGDGWPMAAISGPSFAQEVARAAVTGVVVASKDLALSQQLQQLLQSASLKVDLSTDVIGVQLAGAAKNVIAIATGMADGFAANANTRAALVTYGLAEIQRLGVAMGASPETFYGLAGVGDLMLTCADNQSRNRRFGLSLGKGVSKAEALSKIGQVVEGLQNTSQVLELAKQHAIHLPIAETLQQVLEGTLAPKNAIHQMLFQNPRIQ